MQVPINIMFNLFDSFVQPIWIIAARQIRIIKYWLNLHSTKNENCILRTLNLILREEAVNNPNISTWSSKIKHLLERDGFPDVWLFPESVNINKFIPFFFQCRLRDLYIVEWKQGIDLSSSLYIYKEIKQTFEISPYLFVLNNKKLRNTIAKLRLSSHQLNIEIGRHRNIVRADRKCILCNLNDVEDEYHFIFICHIYNDLRKEYLQKYFYVKHSVAMFITLLNSSKLNVLKNLATFIIKSFKLRETILNVNM